jgi:hypothetical protein
MPLGEVERDGRRAGLVPAPVQLLGDLDDLVLDLDRRAPRTAQRPAGPRFQPGLALGQVPLHQRDHPAAGAPVLAGDLALAAPLDHNSGNDQLWHAHRSPLGSGVNNVPRQL